MIMGAHVLLYSERADADRAFVRGILEFSSVDAGGGWLIFKLPPAELALHPTDKGSSEAAGGHRMLGTELYLMCDDLDATIKSLAAKNVTCSEVSRERWGIKTTIRLPSSGEIGLYQPTHPTALHLDSD